MDSRFESFSSEVVYEIFDYLSPYDIFLAFINLNHRLNNTIGLYPLQIDFRNISRSKFDFVCHHLRPEQVISLILSDQAIPEQVLLFHRYFPYFQQQFTYLRSIKFIKTEDILSDLPCSVSALTFQDCESYLYKLIIETIVRQAKHLTYLRINRLDILQSINTSFPVLTHLNMDHGVVSDVDRILQRYESSFIDIHSFIQNLRSPVTHLQIVIEQENLRKNKSLFNFEYLSASLVHLTLACHIGINMSLELLHHYLTVLSHLKYLTIIAIGGVDLIDGKRWEEFLRKIQITKFNFKFILSQNVAFNQNESVLLESFQSSFWLEQKHWYVACSKKHWYQYTEISIYSIPHFLSRCIKYNGIHHYPPLSTAPIDIEQRIFYSKYIHHLSLDFSNKSIIPSIHRFIHVNILTLIGSTLPSINTLISIVDLSQIRELDISHIKNISIGEIHLLLDNTSRLNHFIIKNFIPLCIPPLHIHCLTIKTWKFSNDIDKFCSIFSHIKSLKIAITSVEMMTKLINQLKCLEHVIFGYNIDKYLSFISMGWLRRTVYRLRREKFTYQTGDYYLLLSIGNKRQINI